VPIPGLDDLLAGDIRGMRVLVRADLNVPLRNGVITDDSRIRASVPTLRKLLAAGARVAVVSHLGRPGGIRTRALSLRPVAPRLADLLGCGVSFSPDCVGPNARAAVDRLGEGQLLLLENLRFHPGEEENDRDFARALADLADAYVNDAFGTAHRAHASTTGVVPHLSRTVAGDLLAAELDHLAMVSEPERPLLAILGGAKVSSKIGVLEALAAHAEVIAIGGAMAYTFLAARGEPTGKSLVEDDRVDDARSVLQAAEARGQRILIPTDHVVAQAVEEGAPHRVVASIPDGWLGVDIGPATARAYAEAAQAARTVFWNGPMGVFEIDAFAAGTRTVAEGVARSAAKTVVGGGDSLAAIHSLGLEAHITHLSTGGGASLEFVQGLELPGVAVLES